MPSKLHVASLERQQKLLLEKIEMFDNTNHGLRELLREWSEHEVQEEDTNLRSGTVSVPLFTPDFYCIRSGNRW